jgi:hypothetical protein
MFCSSCRENQRALVIAYGKRPWPLDGSAYDGGAPQAPRSRTCSPDLVGQTHRIRNHDCTAQGIIENMAVMAQISSVFVVKSREFAAHAPIAKIA